MEFGPEIEINGFRPWWLKDEDVVYQRVTCIQPAKLINYWSTVDVIRVADNHPYYASLPTPTPDERAVAPELVYRMKNAILRHVACKPYLFDDDEGPNISVEAELRSIAAALEPVDEDLVEARKIACQNSRWSSGDEAWRNVQEGRSDHFPIVQCAIAALARGRQLQRDSVTGVTLGTREQYEKDCG